MNKEEQLILWFDQIGIEDVKFVGGKNASLGEMYRFLTPKGINIPNGFCITAKAYRYFINSAGLEPQIRNILSDLNTKDVAQLAEKGNKIRHLIVSAEMPKDLKDSIIDAYGHLCLQYGQNTDVAVRSSATAEDLPDASFAGQQESYLNIRGEYHLIESVKKCFASLFTNRAISYRVDKGFDHFSVALSVGVQKMVRSDLGASGVMFSVDTESGFRDVAFITAIYGLGENIVQGIVNPDEYYVFKPTLKQGYKSIISKKVGLKDKKLIYSTDGNQTTKEVNVDVVDRERFVLNDDDILTLAKWATEIEEYYSMKKGTYSPMDMEWAKDGILNKLFIVQARPETVQSRKDLTKIVTYKLREHSKVIITGKSVGSKIGKGRAHVIKDTSHINEFRDGEVLITEMTDPDWEPIMKKASAIVTNRGGRTCHAAIVSRELGIPCIVGTKNGTKIIKNDEDVTVDCSQGDIGYVYEGLLDFEVETKDLKQIPQTKTNIMMNVGNPEQAFELSFIPNSGVGLAREEFIINSYIKIHPLALLHYDEINDITVKQKIDELTAGYNNKSQFFIDKLSYGIGMIAAAFYPKKVIVRLSDFKSNEYASLIGGTLFEPKEDNPMIGWRGASRYYSEKYKDAFALECKALKKVRDVMGLKNVVIMIPFCRTLEEGKKVIEIMKQNGLEQHKDGLEIYAMCEIPSNVILADQFLDIFDGFSIGSNDLTQLTLGVDRDSELVANVYDERNDAVVNLISNVIEVSNRKGKYIGICGQAPSDYPEFAKMLVKKGIKSMSLNPDSVIDTILNVKKVEDEIGK